MDDRQKIDYAAKRMAEELGKVLKVEPEKLTLPSPSWPTEPDVEGWYEVTSLTELAEGTRRFYRGAAGSGRVNAMSVELGKARAELIALKASLREFADAIEQESEGTDGGYFTACRTIAAKLRQKVGR